MTCVEFIVYHSECGWLARVRHPEHARVGYDSIFATAEQAQQRIAAFHATAAQGHAARCRSRHICRAMGSLCRAALRRSSKASAAALLNRLWLYRSVLLKLWH